MPPRRRALVVIAKEPIPGAVKTRLAPTVGADGAARVAAAMLADTLAVMAQVDAEPWLCFAPPDAGGRGARPGPGWPAAPPAPWLSFAPPDAGGRMSRLAPGCRLLPQGQGDLGDRLAGCFAALLGG